MCYCCLYSSVSSLPLQTTSQRRSPSYTTSAGLSIFLSRKMVQIVGKYEHVSNSPDFESYLKAAKIPEATVKDMVTAKPTITISEAGGRWTLRLNSASGYESVVNFKLGESYEEAFPDKFVLKHVTRREGDKLITETVAPGLKESKVYEFSDAGLTVNWIHPDSNSKASNVYKRV